MIVRKCDACSTELTEADYRTAGQIKVCRRIFSWSESWWGRIDICAPCMLGLKQIWLKSTERK